MKSLIIGWALLLLGAILCLQLQLSWVSNSSLTMLEIWLQSPAKALMTLILIVSGGLTLFLCNDDK